jgi:hypothetical protein
MDFLLRVLKWPLGDGSFQPMSSQELWHLVHRAYGDELGLTSDDDDYVAPGSLEDVPVLVSPAFDVLDVSSFFFLCVPRTVSSEVDVEHPLGLIKHTSGSHS